MPKRIIGTDSTERPLTKRIDELAAIHEPGATLATIAVNKQPTAQRDAWIAKMLPIYRSTTRSLASICEELRQDDPDFPSRADFFHWADEGYPGLSESLKQARRMRARIGVDELVEIADDSHGDAMLDPRTGEEKLNREFTERSKIRIETRKWLAAKESPDEYGEKVKEPIQAFQIVLPQAYAKYVAPIKSDDDA